MAACQVFVAELGRFRRRRALNSPVPPEERLVTDTIETVLAAMNVFAPRCPIMSALYVIVVKKKLTEISIPDSQLIAMQQLYRGH